MGEYVSVIMTNVYNLFSQTTIPGTDVSFLALPLGALGAYVSVAVLKMLFGFGNTAASGLGSSIRGGNNKNIKVSDDRKGDTH